MIKVTLELFPHGFSCGRKLLGSAVISNTLASTPTKGSYDAVFANKAGRPWKTCKVSGFPRKKLLAWDLLYRCLKEVAGDRNP